jgi:ankyrin repeat protein
MVEGILISALSDDKTGLVELSSSITGSMRANRLLQYNESNGEWLFNVVDGASEEERKSLPPIQTFPSIGSTDHSIPEDHEIILSEEETLGNIAFCGDKDSLIKYLDGMSESRRETDKPLRTVLTHVLERAVEGEQSKIVAWLLTDKEVPLPLHLFRIAAAQHTPVMMEILLQHAPTKYEGPSPLHFAAEYGDVGITRSLIAHDREWNMFEKSCSIGLSPLDLAVIGGFPLIVDLLLDHIRASPNARRLFDNALGVALRARETEKANEEGDLKCHSDRQIILAHLTDQGLEFLSQDAESLDDVANTGNEALLDLIVGDNPDMNNHPLKKRLEHCLLSAASSGHAGLVERLLVIGVRPQSQNSKGVTALIQACMKGYDETVRALLKHGAKPLATWRGLTSLQWAVKKGHLGVLRLLLSQESVLHLIADSGDLVKANPSILHLAVSSKDTAMVQAILERNVSTEVSDGYGETPLHAAVRRSHKDIAKLLLQHHASVHAQNNKGQTPFHIAAKKGNLDICELLIAADAEVDIDQATLVNAVKNRHIRVEFIEMLFKHAKVDDVSEVISASLQRRPLPMTKRLLKQPSLSTKSLAPVCFERLTSRYELEDLKWFEERFDNFKPTMKTIAAAAMNPVDGEEIVKHLIVKYGDNSGKFRSADILQFAVSNQIFGDKISRILLSEDRIEIPDLTLGEAVQNSRLGPQLLELLTQKASGPKRISGRTIRKVAENWQLSETMFDTCMHLEIPYEGFDLDAKFEMMRLMDFDKLQYLLKTFVQPRPPADLETHWLILGAVQNKACAPQLVQYLQKEMNRHVGLVSGVLQHMIDNEEHAVALVMWMVDETDALTSDDMHLILSTMNGPTIETVLEKARNRLHFGPTTLRAALMNPEYRTTTFESLKRHPDYNEAYLDEQTLVLATRRGQNGLETMEQISKPHLKQICSTNLLEAATQNEGVAALLSEMYTREKFKTRMITAVLQDWKTSSLLIKKLSDYEMEEPLITWDDPAALCAIYQMDADTVARLIRSEGAPLLKLLEAAASNWDHGVEVVKLLMEAPYSALAKCESIPKEIVKAAAANWKCGFGILQSLKTTYNKKPIATASVLEVAAGNPRHGVQIMEMLLGPEDIGDITSPVMISAAANIGCGASMTKMLLARVDARAKHLVTQKVLNAAAGNGSCGVAVLKELAKCEGVELSGSLLPSAVGNITSGTMCMAIGIQQGIGQPRIAVKPRQLRKSGVPLIEHSFQAGIGGAIFRPDAKPILVGQEKNNSYNLDVRWTGMSQVYIHESRLRIEQEWKWDDGSAVVRYLLDKRPSLVQAAHAAAAARTGNPSILQEFLRRGVAPTEKILFEAVGNSSHGYQLASLLLRNSPHLSISDDLLLRAAENSTYSDALLPLLLRSDLDRPVPKLVVSKCAVGDIAAEMLLVRHRPVDGEAACTWLDIKNVAKKAIQRDDGLEMADWLWRRFGSATAPNVATDVLTAAISSTSPLASAICRMVFRWVQDLEFTISDDLFISAAANLLHSERMLRLLMEQACRRSSPPKLGPILLAATKNQRSGLNTLQWLLRNHLPQGNPEGLQDDEIFAVLRAAAGNSIHSVPMMTLLLEHLPQLFKERLSRNDVDFNRILHAAATNSSCSDAALGFLIQHIERPHISPSVLEAAVANASCSPYMAQKIHDRLPPQDPGVKSAEAIWVAACRNVRHGHRVLRNVLLRPHRVSSDMVRAACRNTGSGIAVLKLLREWHAVPDTEDNFFVTRELLNNVDTADDIVFDASIRDTAHDGQSEPLSLNGRALSALESDTFRGLVRSKHRLYVAEPPKNNDPHFSMSILRQIIDAHGHIHIHPMFLEWMTNCGESTVEVNAGRLLSEAIKKGYHAPLMASASRAQHSDDIINTEPSITDPEQYAQLLSFFDDDQTTVKLDLLQEFLQRHKVQSVKPLLLEKASRDAECLIFLLSKFPTTYPEGAVTTTTLVNATSSIPTLRLLLRSMAGLRIETAVLKKAAGSLEALQMLFKAVHPGTPRIDEGVLTAAAKNEDALQFLIAHSKLSQVSESLLIAATANPATTRILLELDPEAIITENVLEKGASNIKVMELLLVPRKDQQIQVTEKVFMAAAKSSLPVTMLLVHHDPLFQIVRLLQYSNAEVTKWILEKYPDAFITDAVWHSAFDKLAKMKVLLKHDDTFSVARFLQCCAGASRKRSFDCFPHRHVFEEIVRQPKFKIELYDIMPLARAYEDDHFGFSWFGGHFWKTLLEHQPGFVRQDDFLIQFITFKLDLAPLVQALQESYCNPIHVPREVEAIARAVDGTSSTHSGSKRSLLSTLQYSSIFIFDNAQGKSSPNRTSGDETSPNHTTVEAGADVSILALPSHQSPPTSTPSSIERSSVAEAVPELEADGSSDTSASHRSMNSHRSRADSLIAESSHVCCSLYETAHNPLDYSMY